jgi:hypothetical protein
VRTVGRNPSLLTRLCAGAARTGAEGLASRVDGIAECVAQFGQERARLVGELGRGFKTDAHMGVTAAAAAAR